MLDLVNKQKEAIDLFFDTLDTNILQEVATKLIQKKEENKVIYWSGIGKSYNIATHTADMWKSMGFQSFAIKPIEALHGDIGTMREGDIIFIYSKSGNTQELLSFMMHLNKIGVEVYGVFCSNKAKLAKYCHKVIVLPCGKELDNDFDLVPTTSMISFILFCNLLVSYYLKNQNINIYQYGKNHPSGNIGQRVWLTVADIMYNISDLCLISPETTLLQCMVEMTSKRTGYAIMTKDSHIIGMISDGDIRRYITKHASNPDDINLNIPLEPLINHTPITTHPNETLRDLVTKVNQDKRLSVGLPVVDDDNNLLGFVDNKLLVKWGNIF